MKADGKLQQMKATVLGGRGEVTSKLPDLAWEVKFFAKVDDNQFAAAKAVYEK